LVAWCLIGSASPVVSTGRHQVLFSAEQVTIGYPLGATFFFRTEKIYIATSHHTTNPFTTHTNPDENHLPRTKRSPNIGRRGKNRCHEPTIAYRCYFVVDRGSKPTPPSSSPEAAPAATVQEPSCREKISFLNASEEDQTNLTHSVEASKRRIKRFQRHQLDAAVEQRAWWRTSPLSHRHGDASASSAMPTRIAAAPPPRTNPSSEETPWKRLPERRVRVRR
jgi:hypothetical protein